MTSESTRAILGIAAYCEIFASIFAFRLLHIIMSDNVKTYNYEHCIVPLCANTKHNFAVKLFFRVLKDLKKGTCSLAMKNDKSIVTKKVMYVVL